MKRIMVFILVALALQGFCQERSILEKPKVVSISESSNGDESVDATLKTITINFNVPLSGKGYSFFFGEKGEDAFPKLEKVEYINGNKSVVMYVVLERNNLNR